MTNITCATCRHHADLVEIVRDFGLHTVKAKPGIVVYVCLGAPPVPLITSQGIDSAFPLVLPSWRCGAWEPAESDSAQVTAQ
jgi:hypothetical protein